MGNDAALLNCTNISKKATAAANSIGCRNSERDDCDDDDDDDDNDDDLQMLMECQVSEDEEDEVLDKEAAAFEAAGNVVADIFMLFFYFCKQRITQKVARDSVYHFYYKHNKNS